MAVVTHGSSLPDSAQKTDFYGIIDNAIVTSIVAADISASAGINDSQLNTISTAGKVNTSALTGTIANANIAQLTTAALVSGSALTLLSNIPSGAGIIPSVNIGGLIGSWVSKTPGQIYQATTDGFVLAVSGVSSNGGTGIIYSDSSSSPSTVRGLLTATVTSQYLSAISPVKKNDYYEVTVSSGTINEYFIPIGS